MMNTFETLIKIKQNPVVEGVWLLSNYQPSITHEEPYLNVRAKENRILSDKLVKELPDLPRNIPHYREWLLRKQTTEQFCEALAIEKKPLIMLDLGCGNGWFSAKMTSVLGVKVIGLDLNLPELQQAQRLFGHENLTFCYGNIFEDLFENESFDKIVINAAAQYFSSIEQLFTLLFQLLKPTGEIHILDSPFYEINVVEEARKRTIDYYQLMGYPEMAQHYFHHTFQELAPFSPEYKKKKVAFWQKILRKRQNPFPWVIVRKR